MEEIDDDSLLRLQRHFLMEAERDIRRVNREVIHALLPPLTRADFVALGRIVARQRADYLRMCLELSRVDPTAVRESPVLEQLPALRRAYIEAREAFAGLERAIERGYIDLGTD